MSDPNGIGLENSAAIISVGTELTEGKIADTHGRFIASALRVLAIRLCHIVTIPDDRELFVAAVRSLTRESGLVFVTGGLGPTSDDLTREVLSAEAGRELVYSEAAWQALEARLGGRASESNRKQAYVPEGFEMLPNRNGTAPGFYGEIGRSLVFALPGPPRELRPMFEDQVLPLLRSRYGAGEFAESAATAFLTSESRLEELLQKHALPGISWGTRVDDLGIAFFVRGASAEARAAVIASLRDELGAGYVREGETSAAKVLFEALKGRGLRMCAAESCTGGLIAKLMTDIPGSSDVFWGGWVVYSNDAKETQLSVRASTLESSGAVSRETVREMALGACEASGAGLSIAVSGIAGPEGASKEKPVGTVWIGVCLKGGAATEELFHFRGDRDRVRRQSAVAGMLLAEQLLSTAGGTSPDGKRN